MWAKRLFTGRSHPNRYASSIVCVGLRRYLKPSEHTNTTRFGSVLGCTTSLATDTTANLQISNASPWNVEFVTKTFADATRIESQYSLTLVLCHYVPNIMALAKTQINIKTDKRWKKKKKLQVGTKSAQKKQLWQIHKSINRCCWKLNVFVWTWKQVAYLFFWAWVRAAPNKLANFYVFFEPG